LKRKHSDSTNSQTKESERQPPNPVKRSAAASEKTE